MTPWRWSTRCGPAVTRTSGSCATCSIWPTTATTSTAAIARHADLTSHVQIADHPGRGEPGSGALDLDRHLHDLADRGYAGWVGLEYKPSTDTETSLQWLPMARRAARGLEARA